MTPIGPPLVLLTAAFPFGTKSETFLENEVPVLAERFERVLIVPSAREAGPRRELPDGVEVVELDWFAPQGRLGRWRALASPMSRRVLTRTRRLPQGRAALQQGLRTYLYVLAGNVRKRGVLREWIDREGLHDAIFYDYWFENSTLALSDLRREGVVHTAVSRGHGFDIYDDRWGGIPVPFRDYKAEGLDAVFPVSAYGLSYLSERVPALEGKLHLARLGVPGPHPQPARPEGPPLVVSCGSLLDFKQVDRIAETLSLTADPVRWVHFGDGPERARVEAAVEALPEHVEVSLRGHVPNEQVLDFYRDHYVDLFVSLSSSEGLPVSMMEAQAHGIPILAREILGLPEIVNDTTGVLVSGEAGPADVVDRLTAALAPGRFDRDAIRSFFSEHFEAVRNYSAFADALIRLQEGPSTAR